MDEGERVVTGGDRLKGTKVNKEVLGRREMQKNGS